MANRLSQQESESRARVLPAWALQDGRLRRQWRFADFPAAMAFVQRVAEVAQRRDHHPDIHISYSLVTLELTTHSVGGLSERDFELADEIDRMT